MTVVSNLQLFASGLLPRVEGTADTDRFPSAASGVSCLGAQNEGKGGAVDSRDEIAASCPRRVFPHPLGKVERDPRHGRVPVLFWPVRH